MAPGGEQFELLLARASSRSSATWRRASFIHVDDATEVKIAAIEHGSRGVSMVDMVPPVAECCRLAQELGVRADDVRDSRLFAGEAGVVMMTDIRGSSNAGRSASWHEPGAPAGDRGSAA